MTAGHSLRLFRPDFLAAFLDRPNRFMVRARCGGRTLRVYCPNPGRMTELLLPGAPVVLERAPDPHRRLAYTLGAVWRDGAPVPLVSARANDLAEALVVPLLYPEAAGVRREVPWGQSRFDFRVRLAQEEVFLEVKACTLVEEGLAMFPDAPSLRAARHLRELAQIGSCGKGRLRGAVLFVVFSPEARSFMPNVHTDPDFARAFVECAPALEVHAVSIRTQPDGTAGIEEPRLPVEAGKLEELAADAGVYLFALELARPQTLQIGSLGPVHFPKGWYVYAGSARVGLSRRLARHGRSGPGKATRWHIDYLREAAQAVRAFPIRTRLDLECRLAQDVRAVAAGMVPGFGCFDCSCPSHLARFPQDPAKDPRFVALLSRYRHRIALGR